jgi:Zona pellucida-like domain
MRGVQKVFHLPMLMMLFILTASFHFPSDAIIGHVKMAHADLPVKDAEVVYLKSEILNAGDMSMDIQYKELGRVKVQDDGSFVYSPSIPADVIKAVGTGDYFPAESALFSVSEAMQKKYPFKLDLTAPVYINLAMLDVDPPNFKVLMTECWIEDKNNSTPYYVLRYEKKMGHTPCYQRDLKLYYRFILMDQSKTEIQEINLGKLTPLDTINYSITF